MYARRERRGSGCRVLIGQRTKVLSSRDCTAFFSVEEDLQITSAGAWRSLCYSVHMIGVGACPIRTRATEVQYEDLGSLLQKYNASNST